MTHEEAVERALRDAKRHMRAPGDDPDAVTAEAAARWRARYLTGIVVERLSRADAASRADDQDATHAREAFAAYVAALQVRS